MSNYVVYREGEYLEHHGTKGQKWGVRRYQNPDGSLTPAGREHYGVSKKLDSQFKRESKKLAKLNERADINAQTEKWHKYNKRAAGGLAVGAAGAALATGGTKALLGAVSKKNMSDLRRAYDGYNSTEKLAWDAYTNNTSPEFMKNYLGDKTAHITRESDIYQKTVRNAGDRINSVSKNNANRYDTAFKATRWGGTAVAAAGLGFAAYNKVKASQAKKRVSEVGHSKAVAEAKAQVKKMEQMFANTPYADFIKNMQKAG